MLQFSLIRRMFIKNFDIMQRENEVLFVAKADVERLWELYLDSIPPQHNPVYRKRREYDCSSCRHFFRTMGGVVAIRNQEVISVWDYETDSDIWNQVLRTLSAYVKEQVKEHGIADVFLSGMKEVGHDHDMDLDESGDPIFWEHFFVNLPDKYICFGGKERLSSELARLRDRKTVFKRSLDELTLNAVDMVLELVNQGSLYKGDEYRHMLEEFRKHKVAYMSLDMEKQELYAWEKGAKLPDSIAKIRNTSIGTLLEDVTSNMDLDQAVRRYESVVAPQNYKRSKPVFTQRMLQEAQDTITRLGYLDSLERRYANADDISVNNILFCNRDTARRVQGVGDIFFALAKDVKPEPGRFSRIEEISIEDFIDRVLPTATEVEAFLEARHIPNMVSLIAPVNKDSKTMFKWNNNFSWAYSGNVTDSMLKQNVQKAGGKVDGVLRFSIQWNDGSEWNRNDEDAHCMEPDGNEIYYAKPHNKKTDGVLDVDIRYPVEGKAAVENITWPDKRKMLPGAYEFFVKTFQARGGRGGFRAEIEFDGQIHSFDYALNTKGQAIVPVAKVTLSPDGIFSIKEHLPASTSKREIWGIQTQEFVPVSVICYSPNYWDDQNGIGNKHYFFMLKDCVNPELPNAFYNEFLNSELYPDHRKVLEALSSKMHVQKCEDQLSGLGFSSTMRNELVVKVKGNTERTLKIKF